MKLTVLKSFRAKILLSFFSFQVFLLAWVIVYFYIDHKQKQLQNFSNDLTKMESESVQSDRYLQYFILSGYHQPEFYLTKKQRDIDAFLNYQKQTIADLRHIKRNSLRININLDEQLNDIYSLHLRLVDSVKLLESLYLLKGFKDYGSEGNMRRYAHHLEDSSMIPEVQILELRRHEKDYLIRGENTYVSQFNDLADQVLAESGIQPDTHNALENYQKNFNQLVNYSNRLGINNSYGVYNQVQKLINLLGLHYVTTKAEADREVAKLQDSFKSLLIIISVLLFGSAVILSIVLSKILTRDIKKLNQRMFNFINTGFKDASDDETEELAPNITEVERLNNDFSLLKKSLKYTLENLENSYEEAKKVSQYKSIFLANMSHEIRTPLNGIIGMVHIIKSTQMSVTQRDYFSTMEFSANHLLDLINMILDYSKIEAGKMELDHVPFDLKGDIVKLVKIFEYKVLEKGLKLNLKFNAESSRYIIGDPLRLQQILINLINNAVKFTETGSVTLNIAQVDDVPGKQHLKFEIEDSGIGIANEKINSLFEAFKQADTSITRNFGGTGLGLTISNELVKLMGGELKVDSVVDKGSKFYFELDFEKGEEIKQQLELVQAQNDQGRKINVLLAEDNLINQKVISIMLKKNNAVIGIANNGVEAVEMYDLNEYDIVFMDIQMPEMDGLQATGLIKKSDKHRINNTPIVAITANVFDEDRKKAFEAGMNDFLGKPLKPVELQAILAKYNLLNVAEPAEA